MRHRSIATVLAFALALLLGVSSLAGSTVAWFTESVTSSGNNMRAGTLDVEMKYYDSATEQWLDGGPTTKLLDSSKLYMPGSIEVVFLQAENAGSLALKYKLGVTAVNKVIGTSVNGDTIKLSKFLRAGAWVLDDDAALSMDKIDSYSEIHEFIFNNGVLVPEMQPLVEFAEVEITDQLAGTATEEQKASELLSDRVLPAAPADGSAAENTDTIALIFYMPAEIKNEMNFRGQQPEVEIGVHLLAGQAVEEKDSFGNTYDVNANYPDYSTHDELLKQPAATAVEAAAGQDAEAGTSETGNADSENVNP